MSLSTNTVNQSRFIGVRVSPQIYEYIVALAQKEQRTVSNYVRKVLVDQVDETEYLLSSQKNKERLLKSVKSFKKGKTVNKTMKELEELEQ